MGACLAAFGVVLWSVARAEFVRREPKLDHARLMSYLDGHGLEQSVLTPADWARRRREILDGMQEAMGRLPDRSHLPPLEMQVKERAKGDGFARLSISYVLGSGRAGQRVPAFLLIPDAAPNGKRLPAMLALHQTTPMGKAEVVGLGKPNMAYGAELARRGYVVLCPDYPSFGDYACDFSDPAFVSGTMLGIAGHMRGVDLLQSLPQVDPDRIGAIGHSLGGHNAIFLAAFDSRIKVCVSSCGWTPFADYYGGKIAGWAGPRYMPRLRDVYHLDPSQVPFDFDEVIAAIAPRAFFSNSPLYDDNFSVAGVKKAVPEIEKVYHLLHADRALEVVHPDCAHDFALEVREQAYRFIDSALK
jgi:pimeloyl-ACP methyl ester carboxylesterase